MKRSLCPLVALGLLVGGTGQARTDYVFTTIDVPGSIPGTTSVNGINDAGEMVGGYRDASGGHGFLLTARGFTTLDVPGSASAYAGGINTSGQIVGSYLDAHGPHVFLLSAGAYTTFDVGIGSIDVHGINASGQIVGTVYFTSSNAFLISGGRVTQLPIPGFEPTAEGINAAGQIVGSYYTMGRPFGYLLTGTALTTLPNILPNGINDLGQIIGADMLLSDGRLSFINPPGSTFTYAEGINNFGQIVGYYRDTSGTYHGFLATPVPEPSTLALLAIGTVGVVGWAWRRKGRGCVVTFRQGH